MKDYHLLRYRGLQEGEERQITTTTHTYTHTYIHTHTTTTEKHLMKDYHLFVICWPLDVSTWMNPWARTTTLSRSLFPPETGPFRLPRK